MRRHNLYFTLIELLVVVALLGILASLLLPSLANARMKAYQAICTSNLKQLGVSTQLYLTDSDGWYMGNWKDSDWEEDGLSSPRGSSSWHYKLRHYLELSMGDGKTGQYKEENYQVMQCPMEPKVYKDNSVRTYCSYQFTRRKGNENYRGIMASFNLLPKNQSSIVFPGETVAAAEQLQHSYINVVGGSTADSQTYNLYEGVTDYDPLIFPHGNGKFKMQNLWIDGHAKLSNRMAIFDTPENTDKSNPKNTMWDADRD